jgi:ribonuclease VapC
LIAVDTSALVAIVLDEPDGPKCLAAIGKEDQTVISGGTLSEAIIVSTGLGVRDVMIRLIERIQIQVVAVDVASARRMGDVYQRWGRGFDPAGLNFGDCFAYELAERYQCPLLYVGNDFAKTDIRSAL